MKLDRRDFLRKAGLGSIALASLPKLVDTLAKPAWSQDRRRFYAFVAINQAATIDGVVHRINMAGAGRFDPETGEVDGGGNFVHWDNASPVPQAILGVGRWRPTKILKYEKQLGTYGRLAASVLELRIDLLPDLGPVRRIENAVLRIACNIGQAGLSTGEPEGYELTIPGAPFGTFKPLVPFVGLTHLSVPGGV